MLRSLDSTEEKLFWVWANLSFVKRQKLHCRKYGCDKTHAHQTLRKKVQIIQWAHAFLYHPFAVTSVSLVGCCSPGFHKQDQMLTTKQAPKVNCQPNLPKDIIFFILDWKYKLFKSINTCLSASLIRIGRKDRRNKKQDVSDVSINTLRSVPSYHRTFSLSVTWSVRQCLSWFVLICVHGYGNCFCS